MTRTGASHRLARFGAAALLGAATFLGGCVVAGPPGHIRVHPPVAIAVHLVQPGWEYVRIRGVWYYAPRGTRHFHRNYYVLRGGGWVFIR